MMKRFASILGSSLMVGVLLQACGNSRSGGDSGSETHWLASCEQSSDCEVGDCVCGVCSVACRDAASCPTPLDLCLDVRPDGAQCDQFICQSSASQGAPETPGSQEGQLQQVIATCDAQRPTNLARLMSTEAQVLENPGIGVASHVVANVGGGFLLLDGQGAVTHFASDGSFMKKLPSPVDTVEVTDTATLPDGSAYVAGYAEGHPWLAKLDRDWKLSWETQLSYATSGFIDVEVLPDGGALIAGTGSLAALGGGDAPSEEKVAFGAQFTAEGDMAYDKAVSYDGAYNGLRMLAVSATGFHVAISFMLGITLVSSDFEGNFTSQSLKENAGWEVADVSALPEGRVALLDRTQLVVADDTGLVWEYPFDQELEQPHAVGFDSARGELLIAGGYLDGAKQAGTWLRSLDMSRNTTWELRRLPRPAALDDAAQMGVYGDLLYDVAVDEGGNIFGLGTFQSRHVNLLWIGNSTCD